MKKKIGGLFRATRAKEYLNVCIQGCSLLELPFESQKMSWCNGRLGGRRIWAILDLVMVNTDF